MSQRLDYNVSQIPQLGPYLDAQGQVDYAKLAGDSWLREKIKEFQDKTEYPSHCWIVQQLFHPILMNWLILPTYRILGKYLLVLCQLLHILSKAVHWKEKRGTQPGYFPKKLPNALAILAFVLSVCLREFLAFPFINS